MAPPVRILVVDDDANMRTTLADILADDGYQVETAADGPSAIAMCEQHPCQVVLMDVRMPGIDGVEASRRIRLRDPDTRVILMSTLPLDELDRTDVEEGAVALRAKPPEIEAVVRKPVDPEHILRLLRRVTGPSASEEVRKPALEGPAG